MNKIIKTIHLILIAGTINAVYANQTVDLAIVGGGIAGLSAGIQAKQLKLDTVIITGIEQPGLAGAEKITNWPGEQAISGAQLIEKIKGHAQQKGCSLINANVSTIDTQVKPFAIATSDGKKINAHTIIFAAGTSPKRINCPGESEFFGKGVAVCSTCDGPLYEGRPVIIIGNGPNALYEALALSKFTDDIHIVTYKPCFKAPEVLQEKVRATPGVKVLFNTRIERILGDKYGVVGVEALDLVNNRPYTMATDAVFIAIGHRPNTHIIQDQITLDGKGYIELAQGTQTSIPGVFAAGNNCAANTKQAITAAGSGCQAAVEAEKFIRARRSTCK